MNNKFFCIHAHFDLPPQENPWLDDAQEDLAASPFRDQRERLFHQCYGPLSAAPLADSDGRTLELRDAYRDLSFDFSAGLLGFIEREHPRIYARILEADAARLRQEGHGCALACPEPDLLTPDASPRDRRTAVLWGLADFRRRFAREPEGFFLRRSPDAAVLELLAQNGLRFALAPAASAAAVRAAGSSAPWTPVDAETVDVTRPYRWSSGGGAQLALFFHRPQSAPPPWRDSLTVPFFGAAAGPPEPSALEREGRSAAARLAGGFTTNDAAQLSHAVVDGHVFGHLRPQGYRSLAAAFDALGREGPARRAGYAAFLDLFPAPQEVQLRPVEPGPPASPLRPALLAFADKVDELYEARCRLFLREPWLARDSYGGVYAMPAAQAEAFLERHALRHFSASDIRAALALCEAQRMRLRMLAADIGEPLALAHAARAADLLSGGKAAKPDVGLLEGLAGLPEAAKACQSALQAFGMDLDRTAAHVALSAHLDADASAVPISEPLPRAWKAELETLADAVREEGAGRRTVAVSRVAVRDNRIYEEGTRLVAVLRKEPLEIDCWTSSGNSPQESRAAAASLIQAFEKDGEKGFREEAQRRFGPPRFGLDALLSGQRRRAVQRLLPHGPAARREFLDAWGRALGALRGDPPDPRPAARCLASCADAGVLPDTLGGIHLFREALLRAVEDLEVLPLLLLAAAQSGLHVNLWELQDLAWGRAGKLDARTARLLGLSGALLLARPAGTPVGPEVA